MNICDRCGREAKRLRELVAALDGLEVCEPCFTSLENRMSEINKEVGRIRRHRRAAAFAAWKAEGRADA